MDSSVILAAFARCAVDAGAVGIRANHGINIAAIRRVVDVPLIGLKKREMPGYEVYITPEWRDVLEVIEAGADIIAIDATIRSRPTPFSELADRIHQEFPGKLVMADCATLDDGLTALNSGADIIGTTMSGYTSGTNRLQSHGPDIKLVANLRRLAPNCFLVCEGRVHTPLHARKAIEAGANTVVVGTAITAPQWITEQFVGALK